MSRGLEFRLAEEKELRERPTRTSKRGGGRGEEKAGEGALWVIVGCE